MKMCFLFLAALGLLFGTVPARPLSAEEFYDLSFSTYVGGSGWEHARDVCADSHGNVYICGGTASRDFPTTPGAYQRTLRTGDTSGEVCDAFISKFAPDGRLIWSTYVGGPGYDRAYGIEVDAQGYVYIAGRAGRGFPTTAGVFQPKFQGYNGGGYGGFQNAFVAKLSPDGSKLLWASYVGVAQLCRDIAIDARGDIYLPLGFPNKGTMPPADWFTHAFQKTPRGGTECGAVKVSGDGRRVLWATWLGGSANETEAASVRVDAKGYVSLYFHTRSPDMPTTPGAFARSYIGKSDGFVARLSPDGDRLAAGTYLGGTGDETFSTHNLAVDSEGNLYVATQTNSADFPTTAHAVQRNPGGKTDMAVAKLSPTGALLAATYLGGPGEENADGIYVDAEGNVLVTGETSSDDFPVTAGAFQKKFGGNHDAVVVRLNGDLTRILYSTYLGGPAWDNGRSGFLGRDGSLYVTGSSDGPGWPTRSAFQSAFAGGPAEWGAGDVILAKFVRRLGHSQDARGAPMSQAADTTVTIRPDARHQAILGWSGMPWYPKVSEEVRDQVLDEAVSDLGLTRVHWTVPSGNRSEGRNWEWTNDDADPMHVHWPAFGTDAVDRSLRTWVLPFKQRVEARGDQFGLAITQTFHNGGSTGRVPVWLLESPAEFAEYVSSLVAYLKKAHGIEADDCVICKDAGDSEDNPFEVAVVAEMARAVGPRLRALGLKTKVLFPECHDANTCWKFIEAVRDDDDLWPNVGMIGYHLYGGEARNTDRPKIREFALAKGLPIGHAGSDGITLDTLYDDLTLGDVSYWSIVALGGPQPGGAFYLHLDNTSFSRGGQYWQYRQVMHYVRPGAVRVETNSDAPGVRSFAFVHKGRTTVVLLNSEFSPQPAVEQVPRWVTVRNLPPGDYGVSRCVGSRPYEELGVKTVGANGTLAVNLPTDCVLTVYPRAGKNLPPTVVDWKAEPSFLKTPASRVRLSAAAQDPELDRLTYSWSVTKQPPGAKAVLADPQSATTEASGLTAAGRYVFTVTIRDGTSEVKRNVLLNVYAGNQPPVLIDVHNRLPVQVTLPESATVLRGGAMDLEGDKLTFHWSVVSQPSGSAVRLETPDDVTCGVSNISVPGNHVFKFEASDGTNAVAENLTVRVYPANAAPVIERVAASPASVVIPRNSTTLSAVTRDPDGDAICHWWRVKRWPTGAKPMLATPWGRETTVSGLSVPGAYVFELTAVDRTKFTRKDLTVVVSGPDKPAKSGF